MVSGSVDKGVLPVRSPLVARALRSDFRHNIVCAPSASSRSQSFSAPDVTEVPRQCCAHLGGVTADSLKPRSWQVGKTNRAFFMVLTGSICASMVSEAVIMRSNPNEGVTAKTVRQYVRSGFEKSRICSRGGQSHGSWQYRTILDYSTHQIKKSTFLC